MYWIACNSLLIALGDAPAETPGEEAKAWATAKDRRQISCQVLGDHQEQQLSSPQVLNKNIVLNNNFSSPSMFGAPKPNLKPGTL